MFLWEWMKLLIFCKRYHTTQHIIPERNKFGLYWKYMKHKYIHYKCVIGVQKNRYIGCKICSKNVLVRLPMHISIQSHVNRHTSLCDRAHIIIVTLHCSHGGCLKDVLEYLLGGLLAARFLKWMPLMTSTERRPVVALYTRPTRISGVDVWLTDWNDEALSLHVISERLIWDSPP